MEARFWSLIKKDLRKETMSACKLFLRPCLLTCKTVMEKLEMKRALSELAINVCYSAKELMDEDR